MLFSEKYQQAQVQDQPQGEDVFLSSSEQPCMECGRPTPWVDFCFEAHICSEECSQTAWQGFIKASQASDKRWAKQASEAKKLVEPGEYVQLGLLPEAAKPAAECPTYSPPKNG